jgi:Sigma-70 region 2
VTRAEGFEASQPLLFAIADRLLGSVSEAEDAVQEPWLRSAASWTPPPRQGLPLGGGDPDLDRGAALGPRPARAVRRRGVPRAAADRPRRGPRAFGGAGRLGVDGGLVARSSGSARSSGRCWCWGRWSASASPRSGDASTPSAKATSTGWGSSSPPTCRASATAAPRPPGPAASSVPTTWAGFLPGWSPPSSGSASSWTPHEVNREPGAILHDRDPKVVNTLALEVPGGRIPTIRSVLNPDKLNHLGPVADARAVMRQAYQARRSDPLGLRLVGEQHVARAEGPGLE